MNKLILAILVASLTAFSAFAGESYQCMEKNNASGSAVLTLNFASNKEVQVLVDDGSEYSLNEARSTTRNKIYANYEYDGYGGSIELKVPKNFTISGSDAAEEFSATLVVETYSELGHVGTETIKASCERVDN